MAFSEFCLSFMGPASGYSLYKRDKASSAMLLSEENNILIKWMVSPRFVGSWDFCLLSFVLRLPFEECDDVVAIKEKTFVSETVEKHTKTVDLDKSREKKVKEVRKEKTDGTHVRRDLAVEISVIREFLAGYRDFQCGVPIASTIQWCYCLNSL